MKNCVKNLAIVFLILVFSGAVFAQSSTATLKGQVGDGTGKVVPGATVTLTRPETGEVKTATTDESGQYTFTFVQPAIYALEVQVEGFKTFKQTNLKLDVGQTAEVNIALEIGLQTAEVTVRDDNQLRLETASGALGGVIEQERVESLPLNGRNLLQLATLEPGVVDTSAGREAFPTGQQAGSFSVNGGRGLTNEILFDGVTAVNKADNVPAFRPSPEAIQEFRIQTNSYAAEFGRSGGGAVSFVTRSGTRKIHGSLYEFFRNDALDANNFFANRAGSGKEKLRANQFGFTLGGPVYLPGFGEGTKPIFKSNKLFFFVNYEGLRRSTTNFVSSIVPTAKQRVGDYSEQLGNTIAGVTVRDTAGNVIPARVGMIFVPGAVVPVGQPGAGSRIAYAGNIIPFNQLNPVGLAIGSYYPLPNQPSVFNQATGQLGFNYAANSPRTITSNQFVTRIDYKISQSQQFYGRLILERNTDTQFGPFPDSIATRSATGVRSDKPASVALDYVNTLNSKMVLRVNGGWTRFNTDNTTRSNGFNLSTLGFPAYLANASGATNVFPTIDPTGYTGLGPSRQFGNSRNTQDTFSGSADLSIVQGNHSIKTGGNYRYFTIFTGRPDDPAGRFAFVRSSTARTSTSTANTGDGFASLLVGEISTGRIALTPEPAILTKYAALYIQDDWTVNRRLTLNLGLRWESDFPNTERYGQLTNFLPNEAFPVQSVQIPLTSSGGAALPAGVAGLIRPLNGRIGTVDDTVNNRQQNRDLNNFGPRLGFAFKLNDKTVLRGGGGIFYSSLTGGGVTLSTYAVRGLTETTFVAGTGANLSNPFPNGISQPAAFSPLFGYGQQGLPARLRETRQPQIAQWNLTLQRRLPGKIIVDVSYAGSSGSGLLSTTTDLNQLSPEALALGATVLNTTVANPFLTLPAAQRPPANTILGTATITVAQLLRPYPQFGNVVSYFNNEGHSSYHSGQIKVARRVSGGLTFQVGYTFSKLIDNISTITGSTGVQVTNFQDFYNRGADKSLSTFDARHRMVANVSYNLPFGKGKMFFKEGVMSKIFGGFRLNSITTVQGGFPLGITVAGATGQQGLSFIALRPNINGNAQINGGTFDERIGQWFDTTVFSAPATYTFGNTPRTLPNVRGPGFFVTNMGLQRTLKFNERARVQLRAEAFNVFNQVNLGDPGTVLGGAGFGIINDARNPRQIQLAIKLLF